MICKTQLPDFFLPLFMLMTFPWHTPLLRATYKIYLVSVGCGLLDIWVYPSQTTHLRIHFKKSNN